MYRYANLNGNSSIVAYEIGDTYIDINFTGDVTYRFSYSSCGMSNVETMKSLAQRGYGLGSYIHFNCKYDYESKW